MLVNITVLNTRTIQRADPSLIPNAVEECLRFETSVPTWRQVTAKATKIGDIELPEGARLYVALCSANHLHAIPPRQADVISVKNAVMSEVRLSGFSTAGKWPPRSMTV